MSASTRTFDGNLCDHGPQRGPTHHQHHGDPRGRERDAQILVPRSLRSRSRAYDERFIGPMGPMGPMGAQGLAPPRGKGMQDPSQA